MKPADFIASLTSAAQASAAITRVPASVTIAQAALESGWGESQLCRDGRNLYGIKADSSWAGDVLAMPTREYLNGSWVIQTALWRKYPDLLACTLDHGRFLASQPRYKSAFGLSGQDFALAIARAGYATDPDYGKKLVSIIKQYGLESLDVKEAPMDTTPATRSTNTAAYTFGGASLVSVIVWVSAGMKSPIPTEVAATIGAAVMTGIHLAHNIIQSYLARKGLSDKEQS